MSMIHFAHALLPGGLRLHYAEQGDASGPVFLMLHGFSDSWFSFSRILPLLPRGWRVVAPDQRGHGNSDHPPEDYAIDTLARDAAALLDALGVRSATVVGHSMGSFVAQRLAVLEPGHVNAIALVGSGPTLNNEAVRELHSALNDMDAVDLNFIREFQLSTIHLPVPEEFLDRVIAESAKLPTHVWQQLAAGFLVAPGEETLGAIACRTLVMGGEADQIFLIDEQRALARRIPGARLHLFPGAGHSPHWEIPDEFAEHVVQFFEGA